MQIAEGVEFLHVYYVRGSSKADRNAKYRHSIGDPPTCGWQHALVIRGDKRSTILCPFTFMSWQVGNEAAELMTANPPKMPDAKQARDWLAQHIPAEWKRLQTFGFERDYDTVALICRRLDIPVPEQIMRGGEEDTRRKGGKEVESKLIKPVRLSGKRGKFLAWFLEAGGYARSVREAMAEFGMSRSNALSYLYMLQKDHGIGYELVGDVATLTLPEGCEDPFDPPGEWQGGGEPNESHGATQEPEEPAEDDVTEDDVTEDEDDDDSWLD